MAMKPTFEEALEAVDAGLKAQAAIPMASVHGVDTSGGDTVNFGDLGEDAIQPEETGTEEQASEETEVEQESAEAEPEKQEWNKERQQLDQANAATTKAEARVVELEAQIEQQKGTADDSASPKPSSLPKDERWTPAPRVAIPEDDPEPPKRAVFDPDKLDTPDDKIDLMNKVHAEHLEWSERRDVRQAEADTAHRSKQESRRVLRDSQDVYMRELSIPESQRNPLSQAVDAALTEAGYDWETNPPPAVTVKFAVQAQAHRLSSTLKPAPAAVKAEPGVAIDGTKGSRTAPPKAQKTPGLKSRGSVRESVEFHMEEARTKTNWTPP